LKAYLDANRLEEARSLLNVRRPGASGVPVTGGALTDPAATIVKFGA
jgi:hypothetical protein